MVPRFVLFVAMKRIATKTGTKVGTSAGTIAFF